VSSTNVYSNALRYGAILTGAIAVLGSVIGYAVAGPSGLFSALTGAALAALFMGLSAVSMIIAGRVAPQGALDPMFFAVVLGSFGLKLVLFLVVTLALRGQAWLHPYLYFGAVIVAVIGSLIADAFAVQRTRVPYVGNVALPEDLKASSTASEGDS
jgi:hypothetical protein